MLNELEKNLKLKLNEQKLQMRKLEEDYNEIVKQINQLKIPSIKSRKNLFAILIYYHAVLLILPLMIMAGTISNYFFLMLAIIFILNPVFFIYVIKKKYNQNKIYRKLKVKETQLKELENKIHKTKATINEYNKKYEETLASEKILENKSINKKQNLEELKKSIVLSTFQTFEKEPKVKKEKIKVIK